MDRQNTNLSGVPETMLQTLYARAAESQKPDHVIYDPKAIEIAKAMDYDFTLAQKDAMMSTGVIARTILLDCMTKEFLQQHPNAVVINIACGLDTRCCRMAGMYRRWYNLDLPETIAVRSRFLPEEGAVRQIAKSALDAGWADEIEQKDEPVLIIAEGLTMYLTQEDVVRIFGIIAKRFRHAEVFVETMSPWVAGHVKEKSIEGSRAKFSWGVRNGKELEKLLPDFVHVKDRSLTEGMQEFIPIYRVLGKIGFIRNISNKIIELRRK